MRIRIFVTTNFEAFHHWPDAPEEVAFLRSLHRHIFYVRAEKVVTHANRDIEFLLLKRELNAIIEEAKDINDTRTWSCEQWAIYLLEMLRFNRVEVSEDNENGAIVEKEEE